MLTGEAVIEAMAGGKNKARGGQKTDGLAIVSDGEAPDFAAARERPERCKRQGPTQEREESSDDDGDEIELRAKTKQQIRKQADSSGGDDGDDDSDDVDVSVHEARGWASLSVDIRRFVGLGHVCVFRYRGF